MRMKKVIYILLSLSLFLTDCKDPFEIETGYGQRGFLVVDGYINIGDGVTTIKLSRTTPIDEVPIQIPETGATVVIEDIQFTYQITELTSGTYVSEELQLPPDRQYRLRITTANGKSYLSDYTDPIQTPPIDSVTWRQEFDGVNIQVTTHDPTNSAKYYSWQFEEAWEIQSTFRSLINYEGGGFINRTAQEIRNMQKCWKYDTGRAINISSSVGLTSDVIIDHPVFFIPSFDRRLSIRYSILVKQHTLNQDAFNFFQTVLKNNENLGTFSDPQPSQLTSNIRCLTSEEVVVGYISASNTETYRIFIDRKDLTSWGYNPYCEEVSFLYDVDDIPFLMRTFTPTRYLASTIDGQPVLIGVYATLPQCADCRIGGGVNIIPEFWGITEEE